MYSRAAEESPRFDQVLALGRKLVAELDLESSTDTLSRWMAHYVAELMDQAENAPLEERTASKKRCYETILELWSHRAELPDGKRPFEDLEPIMRALESLDPENEAPRYFPVELSVDNEGEEDFRKQGLIEMVRNIDYSARVLIRQTLEDAASCAMEKSREWVTLAQQSGVDLEGIEILIRRADGEEDVETRSDSNRRERELLEGRIERLTVFIDMAKLTVAELGDRLK